MMQHHQICITFLITHNTLITTHHLMHITHPTPSELNTVCVVTLVCEYECRTCRYTYAQYDAVNASKMTANLHEIRVDSLIDHS